ncbi:MAG: glycoside hydrolase family 25 protein [Bacteroidales bacterium]|nr:glycoside hydrolase family 25 protein [Bacteroidales bacterium]
MKIFKLCLISFFTILYMAVCPDAQAGRYAGSPNVYDGVDISHHNLIKSFPLLAKDKKIQFVYMKATEGSSHKDTKYKTYIALAKKHGMNVGSYHFFRPRVSIKKQFENFKTTADVASDKHVPMIDVETDFNVFTRKEYRAKLRELVDLFEDEYEVAPIIYCTERTYRNILSSSFAECRIWLAGGQKPYTNEWTIWQTDNYLRKADKAASQ